MAGSGYVAKVSHAVRPNERLKVRFDGGDDASTVALRIPARLWLLGNPLPLRALVNLRRLSDNADASPSCRQLTRPNYVDTLEHHHQCQHEVRQRDQHAGGSDPAAA